MQVLLIQSYLGRREPPVAPLGLASIAANLEDHNVRIYDPNVSADPLQETDQVIEDFQPDIIGISLRNIDTTKYSDQFLYFTHFADYVKRIRKVNQHAEIVIGGSGFSLFPEEIMRCVPGIDVGVFLEAEETFPRLLLKEGVRASIPGLYLRNGSSIRFSGFPSKVELDNIPAPAWNLVDLRPYLPYTEKAAVGVETKRGCALRCAYCTYPALSGDTVRKKSPKRVVDELTHLKNRHNINQIFFCDPVFNYPPEHAEAICQEILRRKLDIKWGAYHQDKFITEDYIKLARHSGCVEFYFSPDSASEEGLKILNKATTVHSLHQVLEWISAEGKARASFNLFAAIPGTGWHNFLSSIRFIRKAKKVLGRRLNRWKLSYIRVEPNTKFVNEIRRTNDLLPVDRKGLERLFFKKSRSFFLNIFLMSHFKWGKLTGHRNVIP